MSIGSVSLAFFQFSSVRSAAPPATVGAVPAPSAPPVATAPQHEAYCDSPRKSPLFRALMSALTSLAMPAAAPTAPAPTTAAPAPAPTVAPAPDEDGDVQQAVFQFAHALMQALRGGSREEHEEGDGRGDDGDDHPHEHHDHGHHYGQFKHRWQDPMARLDALAARYATPAAAPAAGSPATPAAPTTDTPAATDSAAAPATDAALPVAVAAPAVAVPAAAASPLAGWNDRLMRTFDQLQQALGRPEADTVSLKESLSNLLSDLAARLRGEGAAPGASPSAPGSLIDVTA